MANALAPTTTEQQLNALLDWYAGENGGGKNAASTPGRGDFNTHSAAPNAMAIAQALGISPTAMQVGLTGIGSLMGPVGNVLGAANSIGNAVNTSANKDMLAGLGVSPSTAQTLGGYFGGNPLAGNYTGALNMAMADRMPGFAGIEIAQAPGDYGPGFNAPGNTLSGAALSGYNAGYGRGAVMSSPLGAFGGDGGGGGSSDQAPGGEAGNGGAEMANSGEPGAGTSGEGFARGGLVTERQPQPPAQQPQQMTRDDMMRILTQRGMPPNAAQRMTTEYQRQGIVQSGQSGGFADGGLVGAGIPDLSMPVNASLDDISNALLGRGYALPGQAPVTPGNMLAASRLMGTSPGQAMYSAMVGPDGRLTPAAMDVAQKAMGFVGGTELPSGDAAMKTAIAALEKRFPGVKLDAAPSNGLVRVSRIVVPEDMRNQGIGTQVMNALTGIADDNGARMSLTPDKSFGGSVGRLTDFYKRFGFSKNAGRGRDLSVSDSMIREPVVKEEGGFARGGIVTGPQNAAQPTTGLIQGATPGQADARTVAVPDGSYVAPASAVSALGQGNTMAGAKALDAGAKPTPAITEPVQAHVSDGEFVIDPARVLAIGDGDMKRGAARLDHLFAIIRKHGPDGMLPTDGRPFVLEDLFVRKSA